MRIWHLQSVDSISEALNVWFYYRYFFLIREETVKLIQFYIRIYMLTENSTQW